MQCAGKAERRRRFGSSRLLVWLRLKRCRAPLATALHMFSSFKARSLVVVSPGISGVGYFYCLTLNSPLAFRTHLGMAMARNVNTSNRSGSKRELPKTPTGITGFDEITTGGLPKGRPALICGGAGSGKTLFSVEFLVRGAREFNEPGVFVAFEETAEELTRNVAALGFDLNQLIRQKKLLVDYVHIERSEIQETGEFDLEGLFIRLNHAIDTIGAKRVVLDTLEALFSALPNELIL